MSADAQVVCSAGSDERTPTRTNSRDRCRTRDRGTRVGSSSPPTTARLRVIDGASADASDEEVPTLPNVGEHIATRSTWSSSYTTAVSAARARSVASCASRV